ncbi:MAG: hypothetical protein JEZ12_23010 [Desulfobacterium sp.]|nr:hypothetical protein [Desulfobacterium sp.]
MGNGKRFQYAARKGRVDIFMAAVIHEEDLYAPISKKSRYLKYLPQYEAALEKLRADGTIDRLVDKYMKYLPAAE